MYIHTYIFICIHTYLCIYIQLAEIGIERMVAMGCEEVVLEAESDNMGALKLYEKLGFVRDEKLGRYYLHGGTYLRTRT
jgi:ribosomal protein S18 acetylase RimI-like enzyme